MKIIVAAYVKTGTKSLACALRELGYSIYDFPEHMYYHKDQWNKLLLHGGDYKKEFKEMYKDVDVVIDTPVFYFWQEIHETFPDAKIIFMSRDEESWFAAFYKQAQDYVSNKRFVLLNAFSPTMYKISLLATLAGVVCFGGHTATISEVFHGLIVNKFVNLKKYREHNERVLNHAPVDKMLKFDVREGWEPLCTFLGKEVPRNKPFPHKNKNCTLIDDLMNEHPIFLKCRTEAYIRICILLSIIVLFISFLYYKFS